MNARSVLASLLAVLPEDAEILASDLRFAAGPPVDWPVEEWTSDERRADALREMHRKFPAHVSLAPMENYAELIAEYDRKQELNRARMDELIAEDERFSATLLTAVDGADFAPELEPR